MKGVYLVLRMHRYEGFSGVHGIYREKINADAACEILDKQLRDDEIEVNGEVNDSNRYEWAEVHFMKFRDNENG